MDNNELNNQVTSNEQPSIVPTEHVFNENVNNNEINENIPTVAPPVIQNTNFSVGEDGILKPVVEQVTTPTTNSIEQSVQNVEQPIVQAVNNTQQAVDNTQTVQQPNQINPNAPLENIKMQEVKVEYKEPSKFNRFIMIFIIVLMFFVIVFLDKITDFIKSFNEEQEQDIVVSDIADGSLSCSMKSSDDNFDYIYSTDFVFENRYITSLKFIQTTRGDRTLDSDALTKMYNNCISLSSELKAVDYGVSISCDSLNGTVTMTQDIDYTLLQAEKVNTLFRKYSIEFPSFDSKTKISDINDNLTSNGYICKISEN